MRRFVAIICLLATVATASIMDFDWQFWVATRASDYRLMRVIAKPALLMRLEADDWTSEAITATAWIRLHGNMADPTHNDRITYTPHSFWIPEPIQWTNPDLLDGAGRGVDLGGGGSMGWLEVAFTGYPTAPQTVRNRWPRGVATVAGSAAAPLTVSVGGNSAVVEGEFNRNIVVGDSGGVTITGSGVVDIGVSQTPCYKTYTHAAQYSLGDLYFEGLRVTNTWAFVSWRLVRGEGGQLAAATVRQFDTFQGWTQTNILEAIGAPYNGRGMYEFGVYRTIFNDELIDIDIFGGRYFLSDLTEAELEEEYNRGRAEITKQGLENDD